MLLAADSGQNNRGGFGQAGGVSEGMSSLGSDLDCCFYYHYEDTSQVSRCTQSMMNIILLVNFPNIELNL